MKKAIIALALAAAAYAQTNCPIGAPVETTVDRPMPVYPGDYVQAVHVKNETRQALDGPLYLVLENLLPGAALLDASGKLGCGPFVRVMPGRDDVLQSGETATVYLMFRALSPSAINYTPLVIAGAFPAARATRGDYDGDSKADHALFNKETGIWTIYRSAGTAEVVPLGAANDIPVTGDFDGDRKADIAVFRPATGHWIIAGSTGVTMDVPFGAAGDIPVPADYDGDGKTDIAVYRPSTGQWLIIRSSGGSTVQTFGTPNLDWPVPADYDGDGHADLAVYRPTTGQWTLMRSSMGPQVVTFGAPNLDVPVPGDYDGDGRADIAVYRPTTGQWLLVQSTAGAKVVALGGSGDVPVPGDYDGDGKTDVEVYRPATGQFISITGITQAISNLYPVIRIPY